MPADLTTATQAIRTAPAELSTRALRRQVLALAWPSVTDNLLATLVSIVATVMVGTLGSTAIAAVGVSNQLVWLAYVLFMALGVGSTALVARAVGAGDVAGANRVARQGLLLGVALSLLTGAIGYLWAAEFLGLMSDDAELIRLALPHMRLSMLTTFLAAISFSLAAILRGAGDMRSPMIANGLANLANVVFLYGFINGKLGMPRLGVTGAAVGASLARLVSCVLMLGVVGSRRSLIRMSWRDDWRPDPALIGRLANVGLPSAGEQGLMSLGLTMFAHLVMGISTAVYAAHQIGVSIAQLSFMTGQGLAAAAATLVGQSLGARRPDLAEDYARATQRLGVVIMILIGLGSFAFAKQLALLYTAETEVLVAAVIVMRWAALTQLPNSVYFVYAGALRGAGDTRWPLYVSFLGIWVVRLNLARYFVSVLGWGVAGVWGAVLCDMITRALVVGLRFGSGRWKLVRV